MIEDPHDAGEKDQGGEDAERKISPCTGPSRLIEVQDRTHRGVGDGSACGDVVLDEVAEEKPRTFRRKREKAIHPIIQLAKKTTHRRWFLGR